MDSVQESKSDWVKEKRRKYLQFFISEFDGQIDFNSQGLFLASRAKNNLNWDLDFFAHE